MNEATKRCPMCGEEILAVAIKCKHCKSMLATGEEAITTETGAAFTDAAASGLREAPAGATVQPFALGRSITAFWFGSVVGFVAYGMVIASSVAKVWDPGRTSEKAVVAAALASLVLGGPAALIFGLVMRRFCGRNPWPVALAFGVAATVFAFLPMSAFAEMALGDRGYVRQPEAFAVIAAMAMVGGSIAGVFRGRPPAGSSSTSHGGE